MEPTYESINERKRFFVENTEGDKFPVSIRKGTVVVTTGGGGKVAFTKTNRSNFFRDSRDGKMISDHEVKSELRRMLDSQEKADAAFLALIS
jgi:hypothetical protein